MKAVIAIAALILLAACATFPQSERARACEVVGAASGYPGMLADDFDVAAWADIERRTLPSDLNCADRTAPSSLSYFYPEVGFSADGRLAVLIKGSRTRNTSLEGWRRYLRR